jgi:3-oxoacyl-[acyl-carrier protein] reductase
MQRLFAQQTVLVTGASRGIGAAIAEAFAREGAHVIVNYLSRGDAATAVAARCAQHGAGAWALGADVRDPTAVRGMVAQTLDLTGRIDVLVNNAFAPYRFDARQRSRAWDLPWSHYQQQFEGAVQSTWNLCQAVLPSMRERLHGSIVNLVTDLVERPGVVYADYSTAKSALIGFSRQLAADVGTLGIRVNCVAPGLVDGTESSAPTREALREALAAQTPLGRLATPDDIAGPVLFLASPWARFMTGQTLFVDGGLVMR